MFPALKTVNEGLTFPTIQVEGPLSTTSNLPTRYQKNLIFQPIICHSLGVSRSSINQKETKLRQDLVTLGGENVFDGFHHDDCSGGGLGRRDGAVILHERKEDGPREDGVDGRSFRLEVADECVEAPRLPARLLYGQTLVLVGLLSAHQFYGELEIK